MVNKEPMFQEDPQPRNQNQGADGDENFFKRQISHLERQSIIKMNHQINQINIEKETKNEIMQRLRAKGSFPH